MVKFKPLKDYMVVKPLSRIQSSLIQVVSDELPNRGIIVRLGRGIKKKCGYIPFDVQVGDTISFGEFTYYPEYYEDNQKYLIMQQADIAAVLEEAEIDHATQAIG